MMTTGDIRNNLRKLKSELKKVNYSEKLDLEQIIVGVTAPFLPILHYMLADYSCELSSYLSAKGYDLYGKSDLRFLEVVYKIFLHEFGIKPMLIKEQFFTVGYAEIKIIFVTKIVAFCRSKNEDILATFYRRKGRKSASAAKTYQKSVEVNAQHENDISQERKLMPVNNSDDSSVVVNSDILKTGTRKKQSSLQTVMPPKPHPELALTPVKALPLKHNINRSLVTVSFESKFEEFASNMLDLTEIDENNVSINGNVELVDVDDNSNILPKFTITKHDNEGDVKLNSYDCTTTLISNGSSNLTQPSSDFYTVHTHGKNRFSKSQSLDVPSSTTLFHASPANEIDTQIRDSCAQCKLNSVTVMKLCNRIDIMEMNLKDLVSINNELSAKLILMETKTKLLESSVQHLKITETQETVINSRNKMEEKKCTDTETSSHLSTMQSQNVSRKEGAVNVDESDDTSSNTSRMLKEEYSPIKYTDDDIIIMDFKPIRMKDVKKISNENKENFKAYHDSVSKSKFMGKIKSHTKPLECHFQINNTEQVFSESVLSPNVSHLFHDDNTKETVQNVKRRLRETEELLKNSSSHLI